MRITLSKIPLASLFVMLATFIALPASAIAAPPATGETGSLDDDLLKQLTEGLDLGDAAATPSVDPKPAVLRDGEQPLEPGEPAPTGPGDSPREPGDTPTAGDTTPRPSGAKPSERGPGPLAKIQEHMERVRERIQAADSGSETQALQDQIVLEIETLLKLKKSKQPKDQNGQKSESQQQANRDTPQQPMPMDGDSKPGEPKSSAEGQESKQPSDSTERQSKAEVQDGPTDDQLLEYLRAEWGQLPERDRNMVIQAFKEKFLPQYDKLIRDYYDELARQRRD